MNEIRGQLIGALLVILTAAAVVSGVINFQQQKLYRLPDDGVTWVDRSDPVRKNFVLALDIVEDSAAERAGLKQGDILSKINNFPVENSLDASRVLARLGPWKTAEYEVFRNGVALKAKVIVRERVQESSLYYLYFVGFAYLITGLFVSLRRSRAPHAIHFYCICLASFVLYTFHYTGKLNEFDKVVYWGNVIAGLFAPTIFLHFCLTFPEPHARFRGRLRMIALYIPAVCFTLVYFGFASGVLRIAVPLVELRWMLDRLWLAFLSLLYVAGAAAAVFSFRRASDPIVRQQLKWIRNGALIGIIPFTVFNTIPYVFGVTPGFYMNLAVMPLLAIPLSFAYAILRYRLMDVDVIFRQGFTYTVATLAVMGVFYTLVLSKGPLEEMNPSTVALLIMVATFIFQPLRNWLQEVLDKYVFYKDRYDYRRTLVAFARDMSSEPDLDKMITGVADRLRRNLYIRHFGFFLRDESGDDFRLAHYTGEDARPIPADRLDLSFLPPNPADTIFFERTRVALDIVTQDMPSSIRQTISRLDLTYYVPCQVRGRTIAYIGLGRTTKDDFLSSEDLELVETLSGYVAIAVENSRLYRSLEQKVTEYERLKEFSENIVESINVGIVAASFDDRVESWNSQMESLTGLTRAEAVEQRLEDLFPEALHSHLDELRAETGVQQLYKIPLETRANGHASRGRLVNVAIAPLVTKEGARIGRLIIFDDVTERAELEQRLVQTDKLSSIGLLAAGVAHEVNTPLAVISTYAQMLTKQLAGDDSKSHLLDKIAKQTFRASEIVNSLLNFSRTSKTEFEEVDLNRVIRETLSLIEHQLTRSGVKVEFHPEPAAGTIRANAGKMQQVFLNLFLNARDAMESGGTLRVTTRETDSHLRVEVADTGKGIPADDLPRIYDPFFTTKGARKGTGLGLAVTYGIVREHSGAIDVQSRPGEGTTFALEFPLIRKAVHA